ncbi:hypothetical protein EDI_126480 [Entamoeba dispar SAW760]|uniref:Transmembrane protein n=1 Tax=Entamoeba dispar (strain ATCC PRA-260 / SAW760) TaxID=370354 RepID=B0EEZ0_ENTDS|nr:uncharacterized protein EDI_126480 [Entamoeba dispar SAW760]EDR26907.1 hypothetical protein EDI_126480 [Entamoeba dispar SAW760]|eukprot:EDR26907.1 hypothetical protein EDI_126480 [Entamoeba dispar SAW760]
MFGDISDLIIYDGQQFLFLWQLLGFSLSITFHIFEIISLSIIIIITHHFLQSQKRKFVFGIFLISTSAVLTAITLCTGINGGIESIDWKLLNSSQKLSVEQQGQCCFGSITFDSEECGCISDDHTQCAKCNFEEGRKCLWISILIDSITIVLLLSIALLSLLHRQINDIVNKNIVGYDQLTE